MNNRAVLYLRLSKEDTDKVYKGDDSASIKNQRLMLTDFAFEKGFKIVHVYSDDDESGLYDDRPGFEQMMLDAKAGEFDVIIAKTQSRFTRNMEHVEKYLHHDLPNMGIRFIGAIDGVDTDNEANKKSRQINGLVNEWYCEDLSKNIRSAFKAKMKNGQFLGSSCPYGYIKDPDNHNHLVIDEYAASVVRYIYHLYIMGYGKSRIGTILSEKGILIPTLYKQQVLKQNYYNANALETTCLWSYQTIHSILNNETYTGKLIQNKMNTLSYKDKKKISIPKEKWIIIDNTHEAIIDKETFEMVQQLQKIKTRSVNAAQGNGLFSGLLFCADCKHAMSRKYARHGKKGFIGYMCKTYKTKGKQFCESHSINADDLEEAILLSIQSQARKILKSDDIDELNKVGILERKYSFYEQQSDDIKKRLDKIAEFKKKTYNSYLEELITKEEYKKYIEDYDKEIAKLKLKQNDIENEMDIQKEVDKQYDEWVEAFKNYINIGKLTREVVIELIDKIEVNHDGSIDVYYKFQNPYETP